MKKTRKRILSIFLTLLLTIGCMPVTAWAGDTKDALAFAKDYMKNGATFTYGTGKAAETLDGTVTGQAAGSASYQWYTSSGGSLTQIKGASSAAYTPSTEKAGTTLYVLEVTTADSTLKSKEIKIVVKPVPEKLTITAEPKKTEYKAGENFDPAGMAVTAVYKKDSGLSPELLSSSDYTLSPKNNLTAAVTGVTITYMGITVTQPITVGEEQKKNDDTPPVLKELQITPPSRTEYQAGDSLDTTGLEVKAVYDKGEPKVLSSGEYGISPSDKLKESDKTVTITYQGITASFPIKVTSVVTLESIEVTTPPAKLTYTEGETFDPAGMEVFAHYSDSSQKAVGIGDLAISPNGPLTVSDTAVTLTYQEKTTQISIKVNPAPVTLDSIEVTTPPAKLTYTEGETFDPAGMEVTAYFSDTTHKVIDTKELAVSPDGSLKVSDTTITLTYKEKSAKLSIKVLPAASVTLERIEITAPPKKVTYTEGETFDIAGMEVFAHFSDGSKKAIDTKDLSVSPKGALKTSDTKITVTYKEKTAEQKIQVKAAVTLEKITITTPPDKTKYVEGESFAAKGIEVTATYSDSSKKSIDTKDLTITPDRALKTSDKKVTVTYQGKSADQKITVSEKTYKITVKDPANGTLSVSKTSAKEGDKITVTAKANKGYKLKNIMVNKKAIKGSTFTMPGEDVTVTATFVKTTSASKDSDNKTVTAAKTGDSAPIVFLFLLAVISACVILLLLRKKLFRTISRK